MPVLAQDYEGKPHQGIPFAQRRKELDEIRFIAIRNMSYMHYAIQPDPSKPPQPLLTYNDSINLDRDEVKRIVLQFELQNGLIVPDGSEQEFFNAVPAQGAPPMAGPPAYPPQQPNYPPPQGGPPPQQSYQPPAGPPPGPPGPPQPPSPQAVAAAGYPPQGPPAGPPTGYQPPQGPPAQPPQGGEPPPAPRGRKRAAPQGAAVAPPPAAPPPVPQQSYQQPPPPGYPPAGPPPQGQWGHPPGPPAGGGAAAPPPAMGMSAPVAGTPPPQHAPGMDLTRVYQSLDSLGAGLTATSKDVEMLKAQLGDLRTLQLNTLVALQLMISQNTGLADWMKSVGFDPYTGNATDFVRFLTTRLPR